MYTYIKVKNYKSLLDLEVDLTIKKNVPKNLILIYGENGVGKSNFATIFFTLREFLFTKSYKEILEEIIEKESENIKEKIDLKELRSFLKDTENIIKEAKTINSKKNMVIEFGFKIENKLGCYKLETDDKKIVKEKLDFTLNKNKTNIFEIDEKNIKINDKIFKKIDYKTEIEVLLQQFFGKHTLLSILVSEQKNKKEGYFEEQISNEMVKILKFFMDNSMKLKKGYFSELGSLHTNHKILENLKYGTIKLKNKKILEKTEKLLNTFFTTMYSDIKEVFYNKVKEKDNLKYTLFLKKNLYGNLIDINFDLESTGTQSLLELIPYIISSLEGGTVIIDEFDTGIHDIFVEHLISNLSAINNGQLIITTHNTMLLESEIRKDSIYIFKVNQEGDKELVPITSFDERIHPNLNLRKRYLKGMYGGTPLFMNIDYDELLDTLE